MAVGAPVFGAHFVGRSAAFVLGEEAVVLAPEDAEPRRIALQQGGILASACDGNRLITGGDGGRVALFEHTGEPQVVATDDKRRWIDCVALGPDGAIAWSAGKQAFVRTGKGDVRTVEVASSVGGLAFAPKGLRLAIAHYGGVSLWFPNAAAPPDLHVWKGSHHKVLFSPDGRFVLTAMQEPMLHGWRLADRKDMRMSGYSARVHSLDWTARGDWLATSGSEQLILWPFQSKDGPMGKSPRMLAPYPKLLTRVACHPAQDVVASGFDDGLVLLVRIEDGAEIVAKPSGGGRVTALAWDRAGSLLAFGTEDGEAGVLPV